MKSIDLNKKKDTRSNKCIKQPYGIGSKKTRQIALKDITKECKKYNYINYVYQENKVIEYCNMDFEYITL